MRPATREERKLACTDAVPAHHRNLVSVPAGCSPTRVAPGARKRARSSVDQSDRGEIQGPETVDCRQQSVCLLVIGNYFAVV